MKAFLVLPFLLLLFGNSQESALSRKRSIRGLNTTLQTNFNGTFQIKNPCTNADLETSSYVASHEFHHHVKENNWSDYLQKCSAIINSFLRGIGNLVRVNSKQNAAFNFHVNTSISQKQDIGDCERQCESLPTIVIEAESCELPPPCKSSQEVRSRYLLKQDVRQNSDETPENYLTTPKFPTKDTLKEGFGVEEKRQKDQNLINYGSKENITPISRFSTSTAQAGIVETNDVSHNQQTTCKSEFFGTSGRDFTASITIKPEDEFTTSQTPGPWQDYSEDSLLANPETEDYPYSTPTVLEYQTTPRPSVNDEKIINDLYQVDQKPNFGDLGEKILDRAPIRTSTSDFESDLIRVEKPFKHQHTIPLGSEEPDYVEKMIPPSERFQPADLQTKPYPQTLDKFPLRQQTQSSGDMYINATPNQKEKLPPQGDSLAYLPRTETSYPYQTNEHKYLTTPSVDYITTPPSNPSIPENDFQPQPTSTNEFSKLQSITDTYTSLTKQPFIPSKKFPTEVPPKAPNYPEQPSSYTDVYTMGPEKPINDFYTPVVPKFRENEKIPLPVDKQDNVYPTILPPESVTIYDSDKDVLNDRLSSPILDEEFYIKSQSSPPSPPFPKDQLLLNEKTFPDYSSPVSSDDYKNPDFESLKPNPRKQKSKAQVESESLTMLEPTTTYPEVEVPRFSNFENPSQPPKRTFEPTTPPPSPVTYVENDFYPSDYPSTPQNPPPLTLEPIAYSEASSQAFAKVEEPGFSDFENPDQPRRNFEPIRTTPSPVTYPEDGFYSKSVVNEPQSTPLPFEAFKPTSYLKASSRASTKVVEKDSPNFKNPDQPPRKGLERIVYSESSPQALPDLEEPGFINLENPDKQSRPTFEHTTTPPPVTYPKDDFYSSDYPSTPENSPSSNFENIAYSRVSSQASAKVEKLGFNDFENLDKPPRAFEPEAIPSPPATYLKDDSYLLDNRRTSGNSPIFSRSQTPSETFESAAYTEASSQDFTKVEEQGFNDFENPSQPPRAFEPITPPVTYPKNDFYPSDYPSTLENPPLPTSEPITYSKTSSQASAKIEKLGFNDFENPDQPPKAFEPVTYPKDNFYFSTLENSPPSTFEPVTYSGASSQASAKVEESSVNDYENRDQPRRKFSPPSVAYPEDDFSVNEPQSIPPPEVLQPTTYAEASSKVSTDIQESRFLNFEKTDQQPRRNFEPVTTPLPPVTYPEGDFYSTPVTTVLNEPQTSPEVSGPPAFEEASSQVSAEIKEIGYSENPSQPPRQNFEPTTNPLPPMNNPENDFYPSDYPPKIPFDQSTTPNLKDYPTDFLPTTQSPDNLNFSLFKPQTDDQSESIIRNDYNRPTPPDLPPEADLPLWTKRPGEPQPLPVNVENVAVVLSDSQSDLPLNQFVSPQPQRPLEYNYERVSDRYSEKPLVPLDTTSIPQPQSEEITTPPSNEDYTSREEPFAGDSTPSAVKSQENMLIYSPPFEPEPQPQLQPSSYIPGDNILASKTFENSKTPNLLSSNLESQDRSSFGTTVGYTQTSDFLTTPTPLTDIPSFQTPLSSKPEEIMTDSQQNIGAQEILLFGNNVSPQPQPTTAVKTYKEIVTTKYQTSPAPSPQPQTAMNNANQHSNDNVNGKIPGLFQNQQQLVTSEPDFDVSTSEASKSFSQSEQITENHQKTDYPIEEAPQPPLNYPNRNSFLPYNNQLRSQPIYRQPPPRQREPPMNTPQNPSENFKQDIPPAREVDSESTLRDSRILARMQPGDSIPSDDNLKPPAPNSQIPPERFFYPEQNYNARERYFPQGSHREFSRPAPNFPPSNEPRRSFTPDFQREVITDSRKSPYNRPQSFDSFNYAAKKTKIEKRTEFPTGEQFGYQEKFFNDKRISEHGADDRGFEPSDNYRPPNRQYRPRNFPQHPQQVEPFYEGFPPNVSYPDYGQIRPQNNFPASGRDYPQYDQVFPNPPPRPQFVRDEVIPPSMSNRQFDRRVPNVNENQYYPERPQRPGNYRPDREPLFENQQHSSPLFETLEDHMKIPLQEPPPQEKPNESQRNYFRDNSSGWERPKPPSPLPESQSVPDLTVPPNNPDRAANGRFNYMDRPLRKPFYEDRMRPVSTPERF